VSADGNHAPCEESLVHSALLYPDVDTYLTEVAAFIQAGLTAGEPVLVAVPEPHLAAIRQALGDAAEQVEFVDMARHGRNPNLIIPSLLRLFLDRHGNRRTRIVSESIWPGRRPEEIDLAVRHDALTNQALARYPTTILCPYDADRLNPRILALGTRTHPTVVGHGVRLPNGGYAEPGTVIAALNDVLPDNSPAAAEVDFFDAETLAQATELIATYGARVGLSPQRIADLLSAVTEVAITSLEPGDGPGKLRLIDQPDRLVCEIRTPGELHDFLAGRLVPGEETARGRALFAADNLCDLVDTHTHPNSSTTRLFMWR
jgi:hypothetical protein